MSDTDGKKTLGLRGGGARPGNVKQSFSPESVASRQGARG
jgi:hypothetical protein